MANDVRILRSVGNTAPTGLAQGELAYVEASGTGDGRLYIGAAGSTVEVIGGQFFIDLLNSYDPDLATFTLPASTDITTFGASLIDDADAATARGTLDVDQAGTDNSVPVTVSGTPNYITLSGQDIIRGLIDLTTDVTLDLPFSNIAQITTTSFVGRITAATGDMEVLTAAQATSMLNLATVALKGLLPVLSNVATQFLDGTGTWSTPAGGGDVAWNAGTLPADNTLVRFDGTTGKIIQESGITVDDSENITGLGTLNGKTIADLVSTTDTGAASWNWILDEDLMGSDSDTHVPTQQSVKAYVDTAVTSSLTYKGAFDPTAGAGAGSPDLDSITSETGDFYTVTVAGTYNWTTGSAILEVGDALIAESDGVLNDVADWTIVQNNLSAATITTPGYVSVGAQTFGGTKTFEDISGNNAGATLDSFIIDCGTF